jgi:SAM-dependent methyltransferase
LRPRLFCINDDDADAIVMPAPSEPNPVPSNPVAQDLRRLKGMLREGLGGNLPAGGDLRVLNLACGRCDEAVALIETAREVSQGAGVEMVGADIRIREILQARETHSSLPATFLLEDASQLHRNRELGDDFGLVFLRHQNFWHGRELWKKIFDQGIARLRPDGCLVITSYFDTEHRLAVEALKGMGLQLVSNRRNPGSRALADAPGKSVDRWVAVFRRPG